jgi:hypothetical protein
MLSRRILTSDVRRVFARIISCLQRPHPLDNRNHVPAQPSQPHADTTPVPHHQPQVRADNNVRQRGEAKEPAREKPAVFQRQDHGEVDSVNFLIEY